MWTPFFLLAKTNSQPYNYHITLICSAFIFFFGTFHNTTWHLLEKHPLVYITFPKHPHCVFHLIEFSVEMFHIDMVYIFCLYSVLETKNPFFFFIALSLIARLPRLSRLYAARVATTSPHPPTPSVWHLYRSISKYLFFFFAKGRRLTVPVS